MAQLSVSVIEDDAVLLDVMVEVLRNAGHSALGFPSTDEFYERAEGPVDILIIDLNLHGEDGLLFARRIRKTQPLTGIIMLTDRDGPSERIAGYMSGADLYLTKPASLTEILSAVQAVGRRKTKRIDHSQVTLNLRSRQLEFQDQSVTLSDAEARMLTALARAADHRLEKWQLLEIARSDEFTKGALEVRMARLRKKLGKINLPAGTIRPIRNFGYQLCIPLRLI